MTINNILQAAENADTNTLRLVATIMMAAADGNELANRLLAPSSVKNESKKPQKEVVSYNQINPLLSQVIRLVDLMIHVDPQTGEEDSIQQTMEVVYEKLCEMRDMTGAE